VYSYNFPDDTRSLRHLMVVCIFSQFIRPTSLLCLLSGDTPNGFGCRQHLICGRFGPGTRPALVTAIFLCDRGYSLECSYCAHRSRILPSPSPDIGQAVVVDLRGCCHRTNSSFHCLTYSHAQSWLMQCSVSQAIATGWNAVNVGDTRFYFQCHN
jgi:hypothetical protein